MPRQYGTEAEFDELVAELEQRPDVENPYALANWMLARAYKGNPHASNPWTEAGTKRWIRQDSGGYFELERGLAANGEDMPREDGWFAFTLKNDGDAVMTWQIPDEQMEPAFLVANMYIAQWRQAP